MSEAGSLSKDGTYWPSDGGIPIDMKHLEPGSELDALVAEKVMGWKKWRGVDGYDVWIRQETDGWTHTVARESWPAKQMWAAFQEWKPSSNMSNVWEAVEKLQSMGWTWQMSVERGVFRAYCRASSQGESDISMPHAICLAALRVVG